MEVAKNNIKKALNIVDSEARNNNNYTVDKVIVSDVSGNVNNRIKNIYSHFYGENAELKSLSQRSDPNFKEKEDFYEPFIDRIYIKNNCFYMVKPKKDDFITAKVSNFTFEITKTIETDDKKYIILDIKTKYKTYNNLKFTSDDFVKLDSFHKVLKKIDETLTIDNFKALSKASEFSKDIFNTKEIKGTNKTGFHGDLFVTTKATYNKHGEIVDSLIYVDDLEYIKTDMFESQKLTEDDELRAILYALLKYNTPDKCILIIAFCMACFRQGEINIAGYKLAILMIIGEAGSGKTTTINAIIKSIFSAETLLDCAGSTKFTILKNSHSSNCIPLILDEYKPSKLSLPQINMLSEMIRNSYDNAKMQRGQANQSVQSFTLTAPLIIIGENYTNENALTERSIFLDFFKKDVENLPEATKSMKLLKRESKTLKRLGRTMQDWVANNPIDDKTLRKEVEKIEKTSTIEIDRIRESQAVLMYCYNDFLKMIKEIFDIDVTDEFKFENANKLINEMIIKNLGGTKAKSELERTLEVINTMIDLNILHENYDYASSGAEFKLNTVRTFTKINKFLRDYNKADNILDEKSFTKSLINQDYFIAYKNVKMDIEDSVSGDIDVTRKSAKCYIINKIKLNKAVDNLSYIVGDDFCAVENVSSAELPKEFL